MTHRIFGLPLVSVLLLALSVQGDPVRRRGVDDYQLDQLIQKLGSARYTERERAMKDLEGLGVGFGADAFPAKLAAGGVCFEYTEAVSPGWLGGGHL